MILYINGGSCYMLIQHAHGRGVFSLDSLKALNLESF